MTFAETRFRSLDTFAKTREVLEPSWAPTQRRTGGLVSRFLTCAKDKVARNWTRGCLRFGERAHYESYLPTHEPTLR